MSLEDTTLAEIKRLIDPNADQIDTVEPMDGDGWATTYQSLGVIYRLFYSPDDGYEAFALARTREPQARGDGRDRSRRKIKKVMNEWKQGELNIGRSSKKVPVSKRGQKQAVAIALSEAESLRKQIQDSYDQIGRDGDRPLPFD